jgi:phage protein D
MGFVSNTLVVNVAGQDVTARFSPILIDITVVDKVGTSSDTCSIKLADANGEIFLPSKGDPIDVEIDGGEIFRGTIDEVRSAGGKGEGRTLSISAKGIDTTTKVKEPQRKHQDKKSFKDVASKWAGDAGLTVSVHDALGSIQRDYWDMRNESFLHWGRRIADEIGATFKVAGTKAAFVPANDGKTASGEDGPSVTATYGENLISWDIAPIVGRPAFEKSTVRYFDQKEGKLKEVEAEIRSEGVTAGQFHRFTGHNQEKSQKKAESEGKKSERKGAEGSVTILGTPLAQGGGKCIVSGTRPGIDGAYRIVSATHKFAKKSGYTCSLELDQPQDDAGKDSRSTPTGKAGQTGKTGNAPGNQEAGAVPSSNVG